MFLQYTTSGAYLTERDEAQLQKENGGAGYFFLLQALHVTNTYPSESLYCTEVTKSQFLHAILNNKNSDAP